MTAPLVGLGRKAFAEGLGSALLAATVVGSGIAAQRLSPDDEGLQLLENSLITGAVLVALILALGPVSAAFNRPSLSRSGPSVRSRPGLPWCSSRRRSSAAASA